MCVRERVQFLRATSELIIYNIQLIIFIQLLIWFILFNYLFFFFPFRHIQLRSWFILILFPFSPLDITIYSDPRDIAVGFAALVCHCNEASIGTYTHFFYDMKVGTLRIQNYIHTYSHPHTHIYTHPHTCSYIGLYLFLNALFAQTIIFLFQLVDVVDCGHLEHNTNDNYHAYFFINLAIVGDMRYVCFRVCATWVLCECHCAPVRVCIYVCARHWKKSVIFDVFLRIHWLVCVYACVCVCVCVCVSVCVCVTIISPRL